MDIKSDQRVLIVAKTGGGKTHLAKHITRDYPHLVAYDQKRDLEIPNARVLESVQELKKAPGGRFVFRPPARAIANKAAKRALLNDLFWTIYQKGNMVVWLDEVYAVMPKAGQEPDGLQAIITQGRSMNIGLIALTQFTANMQLFKHQAEHFFIFRLRGEHERKRAYELIGADTVSLDAKQYEFFYLSEEDEEPTKDRLDAKGRSATGTSYKIVPAKLVANKDQAAAKRRYRVL